MTPEEMTLLRETVKNIREGKLTKKEKIIFITGIQAGLYSDNEDVRELLNEIAELCVYDTNESIGKVKIFDN